MLVVVVDDAVVQVLCFVQKAAGPQQGIAAVEVRSPV